MTSTEPNATLKRRWSLIGPGIVVAATGVGAGDLVATLIAMHVQLGGLAVLTTHQPVDIAVDTVHKLVLGSC